MALVEFQEVSKTYDGLNWAVASLDLEVREGEFLTLLGSSGSGKSTTLMMLAGFEEPTSGSIRLVGRDLTHVPPHRRNIGMVFQDYALFPHLTVAQNLAYPLKIRKLPRSEIDSRVVRALAMVSLEGYQNRKPTELSGGQRQRVAVARALVFEPRLVLMDEPLGALDKQLREQLQVEIRRLHQQLNVTIVYVTHDQSEALMMSDRVAVFHQGRIRQIDSPRQLYERPACPFVAGFIGDNNILSGQAAPDGDGYWTVRLNGGQTIRGKGSPGIPNGAAVAVIRPETIQIVAEREPDGYPAVISDITYTGDQIRVLCSALGTDNLKVKISTGDSSASLERGTNVRLRLKPDDITVIPHS